MSRKLYVAGPMRDKEHWNFAEFDRVAMALEKQGFVAISPADMDRLYEGWDTYPPDDYAITHENLRKAMSRDVAAILGLRAENGDGIYLLEGWKQSAGAMAECALANFLGLSIFEQGAEGDPLAD